MVLAVEVGLGYWCGHVTFQECVLQGMFTYKLFTLDKFYYNLSLDNEGYILKRKEGILSEPHCSAHAHIQSVPLDDQIIAWVVMAI
jgi:hypothetical protein